VPVAIMMAVIVIQTIALALLLSSTRACARIRATMSQTSRGPADFEIKDYQGTHWIYIKVAENDFPELRRGFAGLDIKPDTPYEKIQELVKMLREHVQAFHITTDVG
jgi:hypothetical protein